MTTPNKKNFKKITDCFGAYNDSSNRKYPAWISGKELFKPVHIKY